TTTFLRLVHATHALTHALNTVLTHLYTSLPTSSIPATRSVTLVLRAMDGVAYTTGLSLDDDHKEIHFNTTYIEGIAPTRQKEEIMGVLWTHRGRGRLGSVESGTCAAALEETGGL
ncbi:BSP domain containing protein, partial [Pyrenophora tritici-repentis]